MQDRHSFDYAVVRLVPRVEREEFLNVGVILYCKQVNFLRAEFELEEKRLACFSPELTLDEIKEHLRAFAHIAEGGPGAGPIGKLPAGERFRWLTAPRSTVVQASAVHTGITADADATLQHLMDKLVR